MNYQLCVILVFASAIVVIVRSAPDWGPLPYEYFQEFYNHYGEQLQDNIDHMQHIHEEHHESQHRLHENYQEDFYDVNEQQQEGTESDHEALEQTHEDQRSAGAKKKSALPNRGNKSMERINFFFFIPSVRLLVEQRASTVLRQRTLLAAIFSAVFKLMFAFFISSSIDLLQVLAGLPTFLLPCGFHFKACFVVSVTGFRSVCPIQAHFRLAITVGMCSCPVLLQSSLLLIFSGQ